MGLERIKIGHSRENRRRWKLEQNGRISVTFSTVQLTVNLRLQNRRIVLKVRFQLVDFCLNDFELNRLKFCSKSILNLKVLQ